MADDETTDAVLTTVGPRLRALRGQRGSTLAQLSEETGISVSTLSRLESGQRRPTLELLLPLARRYRVPLDELVGAPPTGDPRVHQRPVRRNGMTVVPHGRFLKIVDSGGVVTQPTPIIARGEPVADADRYITRRLMEAGDVIGIEVMDHIILGSKTYFSFKEESKR